jgi:hypothetical protein
MMVIDMRTWEPLTPHLLLRRKCTNCGEMEKTNITSPEKNLMQ